MKLVRRLLPALAATALGGCASYSTSIQKTVTKGKFSARIERASGMEEKPVRVALVVERVPPGLKLWGASLRSDTELACSGVQAERFSRSGTPSASEPLRPGERVVLEFPEPSLHPLTEPGPRLDLVLESERGTRRCVPLELTDGQASLTWDYDQRFTLGFDLSVEGFELAPVSQLAGFVGTVGMWLDRYRLELGAGVSWAGCGEEHCETPNAETKITHSVVFPLHAGVQTPLWEPEYVSLGVGARYRVVKLAADTRGGRQSFWMHGPVLTPYIGFAPAISDQTKLGGGRLGLFGVEFPIGYAMAEDGEDSFSAGVSVRTVFTSF